jgi:hypothetical protein
MTAQFGKRNKVGKIVNEITATFHQSQIIKSRNSYEMKRMTYLASLSKT